jgi:magnesium chelatase subunit D
MTCASPVGWAESCLAAALFAVDPAGSGGVRLRAAAGPVRDAWLALLSALLGPEVPVRKIPPRVPDSRLLGGLDLSATLRAGRPIVERGLLAEADGGVVLLPMAERLDAFTAARLGTTADFGEVRVERDGVGSRAPARFGIVALDEGADEDEVPPPSLTDRLAFVVDLSAIGVRDAAAVSFRAAEVAAARARLKVQAPPDDEILGALCAAAQALGVASARAALFALRVAKASAAWAGRDRVAVEDAETAARLVLAPRATAWPQTAEPPPDEASPDQPPEPPRSDAQAEAPEPEPTTDRPPSLDDLVVDAAKAAIPPGLLERLLSSRSHAMKQAAEGRRGAALADIRRGRPVGARPGDPRSGHRLDVVETLRAAAPWQRLRGATGRAGAEAPARLDIRLSDCRVKKFVRRRETTTIFVVDASGSSAYRRLAEAKGAVELLLGDCYVRRDRVALIAFRGAAADVLLAPTRSLVRAKRCLAGLPGGGGTPLATALDVASAMADGIRRQGGSPGIVVLTDGQANIARDGQPGRERAFADALDAASRVRGSGLSAIVVDTSPLPQRKASEVAAAMDAQYLALPHADATLLSHAVRAHANFHTREAA